MMNRYKGNYKALIFISAYFFSHLFTYNFYTKLIGLPIRFIYRIVFNWILGIDIPDTTSIGKNLIIWHGVGLVVHPKTVIGNNVTLRHNTTIGNAKPGGGAPILKDGCDIGANSVIIGNVVIGENAIVGAGSVVVKDVPSNTTVVGNPARVI